MLLSSNCGAPLLGLNYTCTLPQRTYPLASINDCHPFHQTKHHSTKPPPPPSPTSKALDESGSLYTTNRPRNNILWYNPPPPPFSKNVSNNIGHRFLTLIDKHFPKDHKLRKIFNRNTIKINYSCMNNTKQNIDNHNKHILNSPKHADGTVDKRTHALLASLQSRRILQRGR